MSNFSEYPISVSRIREESEKSSSRIKKAVIPRSSLRVIDGETNSYLVRYRIISEDRNRFSHWSPIFFISHPLFNVSRGQTEVVADKVSLSWEDPTSRPQYDVFVKYDYDDDYRFLDISSSQSFNIFKQDNVFGVRTVSFSSDEAVITSSSNHNLVSQDIVTISGLSGDVGFLNGSHQVTVLDERTFSFSKAGAGEYDITLASGVASATSLAKSLTAKIQVSAITKKIYPNLLIYQSDLVLF